MITIDDFSKVELRIGTILEAEKVPEGDRLLKLVVDFGDEKRQIMASIATFYPDPNVLIGKQVTACVNLAPRMLMGYESQGMLVATDNTDGIVFVVPEKTVKPGAKIH